MSKRVQENGWSFGSRTKKRKTSINLDTDVANIIEERENQLGSSLEQLSMTV